MLGVKDEYFKKLLNLEEEYELVRSRSVSVREELRKRS